jgi:hypothetical protein
MVVVRERTSRVGDKDMTLTTPLEAQLALGLALLIGLAVGWITRGWAHSVERGRDNRQIEKSGVWRCEDRGYYLVKQGGLGRSISSGNGAAVETVVRTSEPLRPLPGETFTLS